MKLSTHITYVQDMEKALLLMQEAGKWLKNTNKHPSKWWKVENLTKERVLEYSHPDEFYVVEIDNKPAGSVILQTRQIDPNWLVIDGNILKHALYIHALCVSRIFAGIGLPAIIMKFASGFAIDRGLHVLRVDTNANGVKLRKIYENLGFYLVAIKQEDYRKTAFYQKNI